MVENQGVVGEGDHKDRPYTFPISHPCTFTLCAKGIRRTICPLNYPVNLMTFTAGL
jgi:hypothetical protein